MVALGLEQPVVPLVVLSPVHDPPRLVSVLQEQ
jgi:hypothetical protein